MSWIKPKKKLGQHFLKDEATLNAIVASANLTKDDTVLEIGPGMGALTTKLLEKGCQVFAIEKDERCNNPFPSHSQLHWIQNDFFKYDVELLPSQTKVIANIPYYISKKILSTLLLTPEKWDILVLLVQKEFAEKLVYLSGEMAVKLHTYFDVEIMRDVSKKHFIPPPKITSSIVKCTFQNHPMPKNMEQFDHFVARACSQKRKTLRSLFPKLPIEKILIELALPAETRLEELTYFQLITLYQRLEDIAN